MHAKQKSRKSIIKLNTMQNDDSNKKGDIIIYQSEDGLTRIDVRLEQESVWLTQQQMADLYHSSRTNVVEHIQHIYEEGELTEDSTCRKFRQVQQEGKRFVSREIPYYNLDMIISLGYRVHSRVATQFRRWATERIKEYIIKGFTMDDERLKQLGGGNISHQQAIDKATQEYRQWENNTLSPVEQAYLDTIKALERKTKPRKS